MNRRNFLKSCGLLPLAGALSIVVDSGASEGQRRSGTRLATKEEIEEVKEEFSAIWSVWYPDDTKAIQEAINLAEKNGCGIYLDKDEYNIKSTFIV